MKNFNFFLLDKVANKFPKRKVWLKRHVGGVISFSVAIDLLTDPDYEGAFVFDMENNKDGSINWNKPALTDEFLNELLQEATESSNDENWMDLIKTHFELSKRLSEERKSYRNKPYPFTLKMEGEYESMLRSMLSGDMKMEAIFKKNYDDMKRMGEEEYTRWGDEVNAEITKASKRVLARIMVKKNNQ